MKKISKILVPVDFGETSLKALDDAIDLAATLGATVVVMHAFEVPVVGLIPDGVLIATAGEAERLAVAAQEALDHLIAERARPDVPLESAVREGPAWEAIDAVADEIGASLIVIGTHGRRGLLRALLGSVAEKVVRTAHQPVLTIHSDAAV